MRKNIKLKKCHSQTPNYQSLSVVLLAINEEKNIIRCLDSVKNIADEIVVFIDKNTTDRTEEFARRYTDRVFLVKHEDNFHINKQKAIEKAKGNWILQLDADEFVTPELAEEIKKVINSSNKELLKRVLTSSKSDYQLPITNYKKSLFLHHQRLIEKREGKLGEKTGEVAAFFIPRLNFFLGKPLIHAGVYPDGVIRLIKRGKARLPGKSVHELMEVDGEIGWLFNNLEHHESPTLRRYFNRMNRYIDIRAEDFKYNKLPKNLWNFLKYFFLLPTYYFLLLYIRHLGFLDGLRGFLWSYLSSLHYPVSYLKYLLVKNVKD